MSGRYKCPKRLQIVPHINTMKTSAINMITYFKDTWHQSPINGWFDGRAPGHPVTNNAIKSYNNQLKDLCQQSELFLEEFFRVWDGIFNKWSTKRSEATTDPKIFAHYPNVTLDDYTRAFHWSLYD
ncbi:hypothetical protein BpHYR1_003519 [Brachionus plicatilis]|uniref:Uncharacterized protein n=1 Tax=Brachionus plicatilis TaxID=10195 RepID=A0A3M7RVP3_BRAPC|nr:hypothetical protein BpHYR1_003519 [Brachionus plicatilis]